MNKRVEKVQLPSRVPKPVVDAIERWVDADPRGERSKSLFVRDALFEKLTREGVDPADLKPAAA
jgi:hypothetical protein